MSTAFLARNLLAEFTIEHRAGGTDVSLEFLEKFLADLLKPTGVAKKMPAEVWAYYSDKSHLHFSTDKEYAESCAAGFVWDNPRVRQVGIIYPFHP